MQRDGIDDTEEYDCLRDNILEYERENLYAKNEFDEKQDFIEHVIASKKERIELSRETKIE